MKVFLSLTVLLSIGGFMLSSCSSFGQRPTSHNRSSIEQSPNFDKEKGIFVNRQAEVISEMRKNSFSWGLIKDWLKGVERSVPEKKLPEIVPNLEEFVKAGDVPKIIWFGHSSFLINFKGKMILIDPVFSDSAAPVSFMVKRFQKPVLNLTQLPKIDYIIISHDHYDHLDMDTVKFFVDKEAEFITPLGVGAHLKKWGIGEKRITELDWWQKVRKSGIDFVATPSQHFSGRTGFHDNETLWASWIIKNEEHNIYFSGDSGYDSHFKEIGEKYGPFDIAFIENGQYNERWEAVHLMPEQAAQAYFDLRAKKFVPIHWGMFELALHSWFEPIVKIDKLAMDRGINLVTPKIGEVIDLEENIETQKWWQPYL